MVTTYHMITFYHSDQLPVATLETTLQLDGVPVTNVFDDDLLLVW